MFSRNANRLRNRAFAVAAALSLLAGLLVAVAAPANAATVRAFTPAYAINMAGDVILRGNSLLTCPADVAPATACATSQAGGSGQNSSFAMTYIDTDGDASTFNSSSASVNIPTDATVLYAGLSWGAITSAGTGGVAAPSVADKGVVKLKTPGGGYASVTSTTTDVSGETYQGFADVTAAVTGAGSGSYTVGNVQAGTGADRYAGWSLAVLYGLDTEPERYLAVYSGYGLAQTGDPQIDISVIGLTTPETGRVVTRVGVVGYGGDRGAVGDGLQIASTKISNTLNPSDDIFNSSLTDLGVAVTDRTPSYGNMLGFDIDRFDVTGALANGATRTTISMNTTSDTYYPGLLTFATDLDPSTVTATKTVTDVNGGTVARGDRLNYSVVVTNPGPLAALTILKDAIPLGTTYVAGTLTVDGVAVSDAAGDDRGEVLAGNLTARLGAGATSTAGGMMGTAATTTVAFGVAVGNTVTDGSILSNIATFAYTDADTELGYTGGSNTVTRTVVVPPSLTFTAFANGEVGVPYTKTLTFTGGTGPYVWSISSGSLPAGLTLNSSSGVVSGTPTNSGTASFVVRITDANSQAAQKSATLTIRARLAIISGVLSSGEVGVFYGNLLQRSGGLSPYSWSVSGGSLPAGLSLNAGTGLVSGTPTAAGTSSFTVNLTDSLGGHATQANSVTVVPAPTLTFPAPASAVVGAAYSTTFTAAGGSGSNLWTIVGSVPAGLTFDEDTGVLSGTPTTAGTSSFTVRVTDFNDVTASKAVVLVVREQAAVSLASSVGTVRFGTSITLTATVVPTSASGVVTFTDTPATGAQAGSPVTLGTGTVSNGVATLDVVLPAFGSNAVTVSYPGDASTAPASSSPVAVDVAAYVGEVLVTEFRDSGPGGADDSYIELYNTGPALPLAGFVLTSGSGTTVTLPVTAGILGQYRSYLVTGSGYSLGAVAASDLAVSSLGTGGIAVAAPDTVSTQTDAVGPTTGPHLGTGLAALTGSPAQQWAWVRISLAGRPRNTGSNAADLQLVSTTGGLIGGVQSALGSPSPTGTANPFQHNASLPSTLLDPGASNALAPNRSYVAGSPGTLTVRRTVTNTSGVTVTAAKLRITAISQANGAPQPGVGSQPARVAQLRVITPATPTSSITLTGGGSVTVQNLAPDAPMTGIPGGLNTSLTVPLPAGLAPGASINVAVTFDVVTTGTFWFGYDMDALPATD